MPQVLIPTPLRKFVGNTATVDIDGANVGAALGQLATQFPELKQHLFDSQNNLRSYINVFVGDENIRDLQAEDTPLTPSTVISIIPAIAGGKS